jgi:hypothetical protein
MNIQSLPEICDFLLKKIEWTCIADHRRFRSRASRENAAPFRPVNPEARNGVALDRRYLCEAAAAQAFTHVS